MKRTAYDSEYDRVRREAGLARPQYEFPEPPPVDLARVDAAHEDFKRRMAELSRIEAEQAAKRKLEADALSARANESVLRWEYERAGVKPPFVNADGRPLMSLSLLLQGGWTIERFGEQATLTRPTAKKIEAAALRKTQEQHAEESLKESF